MQTAPTVVTDGKRYPTDVLQFAGVSNKERRHSSQKPQALLEFLIKTYSNEGETVFDPFMGSGSCGVACINTGRNFIGIEKNSAFFDGAKSWIEETQSQSLLKASSSPQCKQ